MEHVRWETESIIALRLILESRFEVNTSSKESTRNNERSFFSSSSILSNL